jgi:hypothetical protein
MMGVASLPVFGYWFLVLAFSNNHQPITNNGGIAEGGAAR